MYQDDDIGYVVEDDYDENNITFQEQNDEIGDYFYRESSQKKKGKKIIYYIIGLLGLIIVFFLLLSCQKKEVDIPSVNIIEEIIEVRVNEQVGVSLEIDNASNSNIMWNTGNDNIALIDSKGIVNGISIGKTFITANYTHSDMKIYSDNCEIVVYQGYKDVKLIDYVLENPLKVKIGNSSKLDIQFNPSNAYIFSINYKSSNQSIVSVNENGYITGNGIGKAIITITVNDTYIKEIDVEVYDDTEEVYDDDTEVGNNVSSVEFDEDKIEIMVSKEKKLSYSIFPDNAKDFKLEFENSDNTVLNVNHNGVVKALSMGTSTIKIKVNGKVSDTIVINVKPLIINVEQLIITSSTNLQLNPGDTSMIKYKLLPDNVSNNLVSFESSNDSVASVDVNGLITANGSGTCIIKVKTDDGNKVIDINVSVN